MTGTTFPVTINSQVNIDASYDTGATRSCMNYDTFFSLGLDLDDKPAPSVRTASGTDMVAIGFAMLTFAINNHVFTQQFIVCRSQTRPLILGQDFCVHHCTGCKWTPHSTKRFTANHKLILEIDEPKADQFFGVKKSVNIPPRHYGIIHIQCRDLQEAVMLRPDEALKRAYPSIWADTYYVDPFKVGIDMSTLLTADSQVNQTQIDTVPTTPGSEQEPPVEGAQVSPHPKVRSNAADVSTLVIQSTKNPITIPHVIFNLSSDAHIYIPKGTIVACPDESEPEVDVIEVAEAIKEAQETMHHRNHLPNRPWLPVPPESDMICSPAEVKYHRRVELKDHNASADTKKWFEELCSQFPEVFSTNNKDIGHTNLITMDIDTSDSLPSVTKKKLYTLPLKHYNLVQQEIESLERAGIITRSVSPWASPVNKRTMMVPKKSAPGEPLRRRMCIDFCAVNALQPKVVKADSKAKGNLTLHPLPNIDQLYAQLRGAKVFTTLDLRSGYYHIELGKDS